RRRLRAARGRASRRASGAAEVHRRARRTEARDHRSPRPRRRAMTRLALLLLFFCLASPVVAQEPERAPSGPAEVMERARDQREGPALPSEHPPLPSSRAAEVPVTEESVRLALAGAETARAEPDSSLPAGTIAVSVIDQHGAPVAGERVRVGIMLAAGGRS